MPPQKQQLAWFLQKDVFDEEDHNRLKSELHAQGVPCAIIDRNGNTNPQIDADNIIVRCSIDLYPKFRYTDDVYPGVMYDSYNFYCSTYYAYYGQYLLNYYYKMLPWAEFKRCYRWIYQDFKDKSGEIFIRPNSGYKSFTGQLVYDEECLKRYRTERRPQGQSIQKFISEVDDSKHMLPEDLVVIAPQYDINYEWRFVVCDRQVITGCQYKKHGDVEIEKGYPEAAKEMAQNIANTDWQPHPIAYVADIAYNNNGFSLVEINSFSCSGLYHCDYAKIVKEVNKAATKD